MFSYAVKLGGRLHIVKDSEVEGLFTLIQFRTGLNRVEAQAVLHGGEAIKAPGFVVTAIRQLPAVFRQPAAHGFISERVQ
jgi:hypothetical protein